MFLYFLYAFCSLVAFLIGQRTEVLILLIWLIWLVRLLILFLLVLEIIIGSIFGYISSILYIGKSFLISLKSFQSFHLFIILLIELWVNLFWLSLLLCLFSLICFDIDCGKLFLYIAFVILFKFILFIFVSLVNILGFRQNLSHSKKFIGLSDINTNFDLV